MFRWKFGKYEEIEAHPEAIPEGVDPEERAIATYFISLPPSLDIWDTARAIAIEQSTGTWIPVPEETPEVRKKHVAKVVGVFETPFPEVLAPTDVKERNYIIQIAFPIVNFGQQIPMMLSTVAGNVMCWERIKLLDIRFPKKYVEGFKGPKFGIEGIRKLLGVRDRPLINNMIKPCTGFTPEVGARLAYEAALGGIDMIKDDELLGNPIFNPIKERVPKYMESIEKADKEKGERTLYTVNVTDEASKVLENAEKAIELGTNAIMINFLTAGISVLRELAEDPSINVPILAHMDFSGTMYVSPYSGLSSNLILGKLPRLAGADIVVYPAPYGKAPFMKERYIKVAHDLVFPFYHLKRTFPMPSGGITPGMVPEIVNDLGYDIVIGTGGGIHAHPMGATSGGKAFRQAVEAVMKGIPIKEMAKEHEELKVALETLR
ncbi:MAG: RuBisCO large subunit C-terminal-like domain-containing protein [Candidatus Bathyarchaeota archaeon]|nr:RuBisCO large subunit C-terminal-like domain-containing protein [Candidatus Bathyarchaeota archaeon]